LHIYLQRLLLHLYILYLFYFILDHFVFTDEDDDIRAGEWEEGKTAHVCTVFGQNTIVNDHVREKYGRIRHRIQSFTTVYGVRNRRPGQLLGDILVFLTSMYRKISLFLYLL
jgi:hypothetical protein